VIDAQGRRTVDLMWQTVGDVARTERLDVADGQATSRPPGGSSATTDYSARGDVGGASASFRITPVDPLFVSDLTIGLDFPPHTGRASEEYRGCRAGPADPEGTRFTFEGQVNRPLASVELADSMDTRAARLDVDGGAFEGAWTPVAGGRFVWRFRDARGEQPDITPEPLGIELVPDAAPFLAIVAPGWIPCWRPTFDSRLRSKPRTTTASCTSSWSLSRVTATGERREPVLQRVELGGTRAASLRPVLDFSSWGLMPGDEVRYLARVMDNAPSGQRSETREYVLRMPSASELRRGVERALEEAADRLAEMADQVGAQADANRQQAREQALGRRASAIRGPWGRRTPAIVASRSEKSSSGRSRSRTG
jgi:hypothetical protein